MLEFQTSQAHLSYITADTAHNDILPTEFSKSKTRNDNIDLNLSNEESAILKDENEVKNESTILTKEVQDLEEVYNRQK